MDQDTIVKLVGEGGALVVALYVLGRILFRIGERMIAAIDRIATKVDEHTKVDLEHHAEVKETIVALDAKVGEALNWGRTTPVEGIPTRAQSHGDYSVRMKKP